MTSSARGGRVLLAGVALALAGAIAGCSGLSSSTNAAAPGATSSASAPAAPASAATGTATSSTSPGGSSSPSASAPAGKPAASSSPGNPGPQPCLSRYLRAEPGMAQGAM